MVLGFSFGFFVCVCVSSSYRASSAIPQLSFYHLYDRNSYVMSVSQNSQIKFCVMGISVTDV